MFYNTVNMASHIKANLSTSFTIRLALHHTLRPIYQQGFTILLTLYHTIGQKVLNRVHGNATVDVSYFRASRSAGLHCNVNVSYVRASLNSFMVMLVLYNRANLCHQVLQ